MTHTAPRRTRLRAAVAALGATLALTLTACQGGEGGDNGDAIGSTAPQSPPAQSPGAPADDEAAGDDEGVEEAAAGEDAGNAEGTGNAGTAGNAGGSGTAGGTTRTGNGAGAGETGGRTPGEGTLEGGAGESAEDTVPCTDATTQVAASPVERPLNHLLLTVTNTGDAPCFAWYGPFLRAGEEAQAALPLMEDTAPQAVVALSPGETAYAAVITSDGAGEAEGGYTATSLGLQFAGADGGPVGGEADVALPGGELYVDSSARVTYWHTTLDGALFG